MKVRRKPAKQHGVIGGSRLGSGIGHLINSIVSFSCLSSLFITTTVITTQLPTLSLALTEKEILRHLYGNSNGENWDTDWDTDDDDICSYAGVTCNSEDHVTEIDLADNNLAGSISPYVYTLPFLKKMDMSKNRITNAGWDRIDTVLTTDELIANIEVIDVTNNLINTVKGVTKLKDSLVGLHMTYNNLKGTMPSELFDMENLEILAISENELTGTIDTNLGRLTNLLEFYCYGNKLTGEVPWEIGYLTKVKIFTLAENQLTGPLPIELKNMGNLQTFSVHNNDPDTGAHTGMMPVFDSHPFLNEIYLDGNAFTGAIPHNFLKAFNATDDETVTIGLSNNALTGTIPKELLKFDSLVLNVQGNQIEGFDPELCDEDNNAYDGVNGWMNGMVELYGCDAILCPLDSFSETGRQEDEEELCTSCESGTEFIGATTCDDEVSVEVNDELAILAEFYLALKGPEWDEADGWEAFVEMESPEDLTLPTYRSMDIDPCTDFQGIVCENDRVVEISLPDNGLEGLVPSSFFDLPQLEVLDLSGNEIRLARDFGFGDIGNAASLRKVDLSSNDIQSFSGIGAAINLEELVVDDAYFFKEKGLSDELFQLISLKTLHMQYSGLKGTIPKAISELTNLRALNLYGNDLTGRIPTEIGLMTKLWHVDFSENDLTGHLPTVAIQKLVKLEKFHVHQSGRGGDGIIGQLPAFDRQPKLHMLDINSNQMTGSIPSNFLSGVEDVDQLMEIDIGYNRFTGTVPGSLSRFTNMRFDASKNQITAVNTDLCSLTGWWNGEVGKVIDAGGNGCDAILCPKGTYNDYGRAKSGNSGQCKSCPDGPYAGATSCAGVTDDSDNLEKRVLDKLYVETGGKNWTKGENWEDGPICNYEGITCSTEGDNVNEGVVEIDLAGFGLINVIPTEIYKLPSLRVVDFSNNIVDMEFDGIGNADNLEEILINDADLTQLDGISDAPALKKLHISRNSFVEKGSIPREIYDIPWLESLAISYNGFGGSISTEISDLTELEELWAGSNDITGSIPSEMAQLSSLRSIVLAGNRMSGEIPNELENIPALKQLHLNGQRDFGGFTGPLPSFKNSLHLHDLDFSKNSLTGSIPTDFLETVRTSGDHDVYAYDSINLSFNELTGTLPAEWDDFVGLFADVTANRISGVPDVLCDDDDEFMDGMVGELTSNKCNAILCPPGFSSPVGRQTSVDVECERCAGGTAEAPYYGSLSCNSVSAEKKILEELYDLIFTGASEDTYWTSDHPICSWYGIKCDSDALDSGVTGIKLEENSLKADEKDLDRISELFFNLPDLESLNLRGNDGLALNLENVGKPPRLELLQLSATGLTSVDGIGQATRLKELHFTENDISGTFPDEIFDLVAMERLYLSFNKITGTLPTRIGELTGLRELYLYTNEMTGDLPVQLGNLVEIENLVLGQNDFEGTLPAALNKLANLKEFSVYYNKMTGPLLDFSAVTKIEKFDIEGNQFTGPIPSTFLSGLDTDYIGDQDNEIILHLADNALTGTLPIGLSNIKNLYLDIVGNQISAIPTSFCQTEQSFWMNGKVGELESPCHAIACPVNTFSDSGRSHSEGGDEVCKACGAAEVAPFVGSYTCTQASVEIEALKDLYRSLDGESWDNNENWMDYTKPICSWFGISCAGDSLENSTVTAINLPDNSLDGTMPHQIWSMPALESLNLKENSVFMGFKNIGQAKKLEVLYISDIDIDSIEGIGKAPALTELHLTANGIKGELPDDFFELADTMERLYIAYNSFSGALSTEIGKMTNLIDFYAYDNEFTGTIPSEIASLKNLQNFVVAENKLSGTIAEEFSYMSQLKLFSAYRRLKAGPKLTGPLPTFSNAPNLEGLYLDYNHLAGTIPSNFLKSSLNTKLITISHNQLSGEVPTDLMAIDAINIEMEGNKITGFDERFCDDNFAMDGLVADYGCDAFMCAPGYFSIYGRQNSTATACKRCEVTDEDEEPSPYWGSATCDGVVDDKEILELLYSETKGDNWYNNKNWLKTPNVCTWYGVKCSDGKTVESLHLGANNLVGTPPEELFHLAQLHTLWLHSNPIDFKFKGIGKAKNLIDLRVDSTGLKDVVGVGDALNLVKLDLKYNQISGRFPNELLNIGTLRSLSLTDNSLSGAIPDSFGELTGLIELRLGSNLFSGELPTFGDLEDLVKLDLSDNDLAGQIPPKFLSGVSERGQIEVDLSSNNLSGSVPLELDRLSQLVIYLRDNKFTGLSPSLCDSDNKGWNSKDVELFGCNALMCPPGTANFHGRQSSNAVSCMKCESNTNLYGQITCNGMPLLASSSSRLLQGGVVMLVSSLLVVGMAFLI